MKLRSIRVFLFLFLLSLHSFSLFSESAPKGRQLCQEVFNFLTGEGFSPKTQSLLVSPENDFPYNIYLEFETDINCTSNLLVIFEMENILTKTSLVKNYLHFLENSQYDYNTTVLFAYGENQSLNQSLKIDGLDVFLDNFFTNENYSALYIELEEENNRIIVSSNNTISPGHLIKASFNSCLKNKIPVKHNFLYLSQLYFVADQTEKNLQTLFDNEIPSIKLCFDRESDEEKVERALEEITNQTYENDYWDNWEQHFILINLFSQYRILCEKTILIFFIFVIGVILLFIFVLGYINSFIKAVAWKNIRYIWYAAPATVLIIILGFIIGKQLFFNFSPKSDYSKIYLLLWLQSNTALILVSVFYTILARLNFKFTERSIDYLILLSTFINQSFFSCLDISLFPMFLLIFISAFFTIIFRRFFSHIYLLILLSLLSIPYAHSFLEITDSRYALNFLLNSRFWYFAVALVITPMSLLYFRVLIKFRQGIKNNFKVTVFSLGYIFLIMLSFSLICFINLPKRNKNISKENKEKTIIASPEDTIQITVSDLTIFDDLIRTIHVDTGKSVEVCNVTVQGITKQPLLYSDYEAEALNNLSSTFMIPTNPPQKLTFSYGSAKEAGFVKVTIIYSKDDSDLYYLEEKVITLYAPDGEK